MSQSYLPVIPTVPPSPGGAVFQGVIAAPHRESIQARIGEKNHGFGWEKIRIHTLYIYYIYIIRVKLESQIFRPYIIICFSYIMVSPHVPMIPFLFHPFFSDGGEGTGHRGCSTASTTCGFWIPASCWAAAKCGPAGPCSGPRKQRCGVRRGGWPGLDGQKIFDDPMVTLWEQLPGLVNIQKAIEHGHL